MDVNNIESVYEYQGIDEDDVLFDEIRRQILVLTADDEDHQETDVIDSVSSVANKPGTRRALGNLSSLQHGRYFNWPDTENTDSVPTWLVNLWRTGNGTGVFIPHINKSTRRHRPGRVNRRRVYRPVETKQS
ncbi:BZIP transcription factor family protein isoform 1 [Hibiscus syriacus]|uniref:BZIP transcription factor family protein isoform 1 n=1 Tax=Hibiscus syriacus TaxID=106335 RepID=A0A6A3C7C0_HIBSY|nr:uncharacterized protein LOC120203799 [Hibiscus syriacus]KAE8724634.1 BZIP transcription factor family protein isoform 1 [Hibiscus syriacus]